MHKLIVHRAYDFINQDIVHTINGLGLFEIDVLKGGNPPSHICTFDYLDESIKDETLKITALKEAWEEYRSDDTIYDDSDLYMPGCIVSDPIEG